MRTGTRIHTMKKLFNIREGWQPKDDWLPERLLSEKLPTGVGAGIGLCPDELRQMIQTYYQARSWDENGFVPEKKLAELSLPTVMCCLRKTEPGIRETMEDYSKRWRWEEKRFRLIGVR